METQDGPFVRICIPCEWTEMLNNADGGFPIKGMRATMRNVFDPLGNEILMEGVYEHGSGAFHPLERHKAHLVDRTEERERAAMIVMEHIWTIPFDEDHAVTCEDYESLFQCYMMVFSNGVCKGFDQLYAASSCVGDGGPNRIDVEMLKVARRVSHRGRLGLTDYQTRSVRARPMKVVWRDSVEAHPPHDSS